jgi:hypothetical protein
MYMTRDQQTAPVGSFVQVALFNEIDARESTC